MILVCFRDRLKDTAKIKNISDKLSDAQMVKLVAGMQDLDGDGKMNFEEFKLMLSAVQ